MGSRAGVLAVAAPGVDGKGASEKRWTRRSSPRARIGWRKAGSRGSTARWSGPATGLLWSAGIEARRRRHQRARVRLGFCVVYGGEGCLPSCPCGCGPACRPVRAASAVPACAHGSRAPGATSAAAGGKAQGGGRERQSGDSTPRPKMRSGDSTAGISIPCCLTQGHFRLFTAT